MISKNLTISQFSFYPWLVQNSFYRNCDYFLTELCFNKVEFPIEWIENIFPDSLPIIFKGNINFIESWSFSNGNGGPSAAIQLEPIHSEPWLEHLNRVLVYSVVSPQRRVISFLLSLCLLSRPYVAFSGQRPAARITANCVCLWMTKKLVLVGYLKLKIIK